MYAKVFSSLWNGSLVGQSGPQLVFVYLLANCNADGCVDIHPRVIASLTGLPESEVRSALSTLESPDPTSRSVNQEGARIERMDAHRDWGWQIVNHSYYRSLKDPDTLKVQTRARVAKHREMKRSVTLGNALKRHTDADNRSQKSEALEPNTSPLNGSGGGLMTAESMKNKQAEWLEAFENAFYPEYPRKVKPDEARKAWLQMKPWSQVNCDLIYQGLQSWKGYWNQHQVAKDKIPYPASFLRSGQWKADPE